MAKRKEEGASSRRSAYESFLTEVVKDFDEKVLALQEVAEWNCKSYERWCSELKSAHLEMKSNLRLLQGAIRAQLLESSEVQETHLCVVAEGTLAGHKFLLVWDASRGDYMYDPGLSPCQQHLEQTSNFLGDKLYFPKDMLSRFLANIHYITYYKQSS